MTQAKTGRQAIERLINSWKSESLRLKSLGSPTLWEQGETLSCCAEELMQAISSEKPSKS